METRKARPGRPVLRRVPRPARSPHLSRSAGPACGQAPSSAPSPTRGSGQGSNQASGQASGSAATPASIPGLRPDRCPHCGGGRFRSHGTFLWRDGTRRPRYRCVTCGQTFNPHTGTPDAYIKKRTAWQRVPECIVRCLSVRSAAVKLGVHPSTAFHWRHRVLWPLHRRPQSRLEGAVALSEAYIRYSEKGSRRTNGPGSWGAGRHVPGLGWFRRFRDGKPAFVLLACTRKHQAGVVVCQGLPSPDALGQCLGQLLDPRARVYSGGLAPYHEACRLLGLAHRVWREVPRDEAKRELPRPGATYECQDLYGWLKRFFGVATRYLGHYLAWFLFQERTAGMHPGRAALRLRAEVTTRAPGWCRV